ncbi:uncharacterized protein DUF262 [Brachybacterium sp. AG952]|uniref:DUF262 domain-containing protein n=1 Tax=Brachybacterium sp. AG952 TaxID=2183989 RepID=UPI00105F6531|nr:DUF262 domain-containing protein [Brachybacterium sp. AG952]TDP79288.1 uncharacterized protein DUF262 [Brachybacterium sp. AG952]
MPYLPATTIAAILAQIERKDLILPAIQREYVWKPQQVVALFDSIMRGYPIGSFLSWRVEQATAQEFRFYDFLNSYNELDMRHNPERAVPPNQPVVAVLDGQQRLTSLNIGLRGTYAMKKKYAWSGIPENYPARTLHVSLHGHAPGNAAGLLYDLRFLSEAQLAALDPEEARYWLPVPAVLSAGPGMGLWRVLAERDLGNDTDAMEIASLLAEKVHSEHSVHFFEEADQDIERVLDIFIRVNSGGTVLSYSDLLLSIATAQWKNRDARKEVHGLVDELNATGIGFRFSKDLILKTGLVLSGVPDVAFKVKNFTAANMARLDAMWDEIAASLRLTVGLLSDFGLSGTSLTASSIVIPLAQYVHHRGLDQSYREAASAAGDRAALKNWVLRALIVPGIWGSGLDQLLQSLRNTILEHGDAGFPVDEIDTMMAGRGKSLTVTDELIETILDYEFGDGETFGVLAIMFPHVNTRNIHHVDHIVPRARLNRASLRTAGVDDGTIEEILAKRDGLSNLELLEGSENVSKSAKMPLDWAQEVYTSPEAYSAYLDRNALPELIYDPADYLMFYETRRSLLRTRILRAFGLSEPPEKAPHASATQAETIPPLDESIEASGVELLDD